MACGKPPDPDARTSPTPLNHPVVAPVAAALKEAESIISTHPPGASVDAAIVRAERVLQNAIRNGVGESIAQKLQGRLDHLKGFAQARMRDNVSGSAKPRSIDEKGASTEWVEKQFSEGSAKRNAPTVIKALETEDHWRSREYKECLLRLVEQNSRIPETYREQLPHDVARVLRVCPDAAGLVKAMTLRGQNDPVGSRAKLGSNSNAAIGSAYELMGTAALIDKVSTPVNGGPELFISSAFDKVTFGPKSTINREMNRLGIIELPTRRSIECDIRIGRPNLLGVFREIGVDFKHSMEGTRHASGDLKNQVENVTKAIRHGEIDEYHFVSNGRFATSFREVIASANKELQASGCGPIACHEYVTTVPHWPFEGSVDDGPR
jgi:hypothetical protein